MTKPMHTYNRMTKIEFWNDWRPWMAIAFVGLFFVTGWLGTLNARALKKDAVHRAEVNRCLATRPLLRKFALHVQGVNDIARVLVFNSKAIVKQTSHPDPQYKVRIANLHRLERAQRKIAALPGFPVPSLTQCHTQKP